MYASMTLSDVSGQKSHNRPLYDCIYLSHFKYQNADTLQQKEPFAN